MMDDDGGDGSMVCTDHPFKNSSPGGGICAFCLQEKLGKLVSSSFPIAVFPASSSSESPSFRSASDQTTTTTISLSNPTLPHHSNTNNNDSSSANNRSKILYLLSSSSSSSHQKNRNKNTDNSNLVFKRSKSTAAPRKPRFMDATASGKRGFWSFMYKAKQSQSAVTSTSTSTSFQRSRQQETTKGEDNIIVVEENESPSYDRRKVSRSRSVGCGSRSFSGDFFERISTGFGDCTLRRVESQREGKPKVSSSVVGNDCIKERVRCGGLFSGFMITSSSSSNSSSSSYWVASNPNVKPPSVVAVTAAVQHSRSKSWGWGLASPMRAFNKHSSSKREKQQNPTPNLAAIPSLLSVRS